MNDIGTLTEKLGRSIDVVETSRGCTFDCSFCSIIEMRGRNFHRFPLERVMNDIADARSRGARAIFIVDDNVTLDVVTAPGLGAAALDQLMLNILASFAEFERDLAASRIAEARAHLKGHGRRIAGAIPFGYVADPHTKQLVVCVKNDGYTASLERRKLYLVVREAAAEKHGHNDAEQKAHGQS